jgi:hypothetical protein
LAKELEDGKYSSFDVEGGRSYTKDWEKGLSVLDPKEVEKKFGWKNEDRKKYYSALADKHGVKFLGGDFNKVEDAVIE